MVKVGDTLSGITAPSTRGVFDIEARRGRWLVLYFYPKDNTSGCTLEGRDFSARVEAFDELGCDVVGVSRDSVKSHEGFCARQDLRIELVSDRDETLCALFDVIKPKVMYGKSVRGVVRSTYVVDPQGVVRRIWSGVKVPGHVAEVLAELKAMQV